MEDVKVRESRSYNGDIIILLFFTFVVVFAIIRLFLGIFKEDVSVVENCTLGIQNDIKFLICTDVDGESSIELVEEADASEPVDIKITEPEFEPKKYRAR